MYLEQLQDYIDDVTLTTGILKSSLLKVSADMEFCIIWRKNMFFKFLGKEWKFIYIFTRLWWCNTEYNSFQGAEAVHTGKSKVGPMHIVIGYEEIEV